MEYLKQNGTNTEGIFRREGDRTTFQKIVAEMIENDKNINYQNECEFNNELEILKTQEFNGETGKNYSESLSAVKTKADFISSTPNLFEFRKYGILELASALKYYARDVINGIFDVVLIKEPIKRIKSKSSNSLIYCKYLFFSLSEDQRRFLLSLRELLYLIQENKINTHMSWEGICNVLALTITPQEMYTTLGIIDAVVELFRIIMELDSEDLSEMSDLL